MDQPAPLEPLDETWERALCIVAHPDDMEFGAAAAVARWTGQGKWVGYTMVTSGEAGIDGLQPDECRAVREAEQVESARIVGVESVDFLRQPDGDPGVRRADAPAAHRRGPPAPPRHRDHRQLPRHLRRPQPQPGRPHRRRQGGRSTPSATPATAGSSPSSSEGDLEPWGGVRAVWAAGSPQSDARRRHHRHLRRGRGVAEGARGVHRGPGLGELGPGASSSRASAAPPASGSGSPSPRRSRCSRWAGALAGSSRTRSLRARR